MHPLHCADWSNKLQIVELAIGSLPICRANLIAARLDYVCSAQLMVLYMRKKGNMTTTQHYITTTWHDDCNANTQETKKTGIQEDERVQQIEFFKQQDLQHVDLSLRACPAQLVVAGVRFTQFGFNSNEKLSNSSEHTLLKRKSTLTLF